VVVKSAPATALTVVETELILHLLEVALDTPPDLGEADQLVERDVVRGSRQPVFDGFGLVDGPLDEQPLSWTC